MLDEMNTLKKEYELQIEKELEAIKSKKERIDKEIERLIKDLEGSKQSCEMWKVNSTSIPEMNMINPLNLRPKKEEEL